MKDIIKMFFDNLLYQVPLFITILTATVITVAISRFRDNIRRISLFIWYKICPPRHDIIMATNEIYFVTYFEYGMKLIIPYKKKPGMKRICKVMYGGETYNMDKSFIEVIKDIPGIEIHYKSRRSIKSQ